MVLKLIRKGIESTIASLLGMLSISWVVEYRICWWMEMAKLRQPSWELLCDDAFSSCADDLHLAKVEKHGELSRNLINCTKIAMTKDINKRADACVMS
jgi:hypothetical protein